MALDIDAALSQGSSKSLNIDAALSSLDIDSALSEATPEQQLEHKTQEYTKNPKKALSDIASWDLPLGIVEQIPAGVQALGGIGVGAVGAIKGLVTPGETAQQGWQEGQEWFAGTPVSKVLTPQTQSGQAITGTIGAGVNYMKEQAQNPEVVKSMLGAVPFVGENLKESVPAQAALSGYLSAVPELSMVAPGLAHGKGESLPKTKEVIPPHPEDAPANITFMDAVKSSIDQASKDKVYAESKIEALKRSLEDPTLAQDTPAKAEAMRKAIHEQIKNHETDVERLNTSIENGNKILKGEEPTTATVPKEEPIPTQVDMFDQEGRPTRQADVVQQASVDDLQRTATPDALSEAQVGIERDQQNYNVPSKDWTTASQEELAAADAEWRAANPQDGSLISGERVSTEQVVPSEHIDITAPVDNRPIHELDIDTVGDRIGEVMDGTRSPEELKPLMERRAVLEEEARPAQIIKGGDEGIRNVVNQLLDKLGLRGERMTIDLEAVTEKENWAGDAGIDESGNARVRVRPIEDSLNNPEFKGWFGKLNKEQNARLKQVWTAAHEIGHVMLGKLIQNKLYNGDTLQVSKLLADFDAWKEKKGVEQVRGEGNLMARPKDPDYYLDFPEYFAQRVAKEMTMGLNAPRGAIRDYIGDMRGAIRSLIAAAKIPFFKSNFVDAFIRDIVSANKEQLAKTGQTLFEVHSTKGSIHDAWVWQNENMFAKKRKASDVAEMRQPTQSEIHIEDAKDVLAKQLAVGKDINPLGTGAGMKMVGDIVARHASKLLGLQQKKGFFFDSPMIVHASNVILASLNKQQRRSMQLLSGATDYAAWKKSGLTFWTRMSKIQNDDSPAIIFHKSTNEDFHEVQKVLEQGIGTKTYAESLAEFGGHLTDAQKTLFNTIAKLSMNMRKMAKESAQELGKKNIIPNMKGWYPAVRQGDFVINWHIPGLQRMAGRSDSGMGIMTDLVHSQRYRTKEEAMHDLARWEALPKDQKGTMKHFGVEEVGQTDLPNTMEDFFRAVKEQTAMIKEQGGSFADLEEAQRRMQDQMIARGGTLGKHHALRTNVTGAKGSEMFKTVGEAGKAFRDAQFDSIQEYTRQMMKMEVGEKLGLVLDDKEVQQRFPNTQSVVEQMREHALNETKTPLEMKGLKRWTDTFWINAIAPKMPGALKQNRFPDAHIADIFQSRASHVFYTYALTTRPSFWVAQAAQSAWIMRSLVKDGSSLVDATATLGKGSKQLIMPDEDFIKSIFHHTQTRDTFAPQFAHDLNKYHIVDFLQEGSKRKLLIDILTGEKQSSMADSLSRIMAYSATYEHFKAKGLKGEELWNKAGEVMDENMVKYGVQYKAPIFKKLGFIGDLISPLQAFSTAAFGNLATDFRVMLKDPQQVGHVKAALPLVSTMMITGLLGGLIGLPMGAEYEAVAQAERAMVDKLAGWEATSKMINYISEELGMSLKMPSLIDVVLAGDNTFSHRVLSHGLISASTMAATEGEGLDIASSLRYQPLFNGILEGQKTWADWIPQFKFAGQEIGYASTVVGNLTGLAPASDAEEQTAVLGLVPGYAKGIVADLKGYNEPAVEMTTKGQALVPASKTTHLAKYLGTKTIPQSVEQLRNQQIYQKKLLATAAEKKLSMRMVDAVQHQDFAKAREIGKQIAVKYGRDDAHLNKVANAELFRRTVPEAQRRIVNQAGTAKEQAFKDYMELYGDNPFSEEQ